MTKEIIELGEGFRMPGNQWRVYIQYKMYFFDHTFIESSKEEYIGVNLNDKSWPEGLRMAIGKMRKGERAKIKIKKTYGFANTLDPELLRVPESIDTEELKEKLKTKGIIYEVHLKNWDI